ncbi:hypothetical protein ACHQM5_019172 [Ranunculus cassubicifolius]
MKWQVTLIMILVLVNHCSAARNRKVGSGNRREQQETSASAESIQGQEEKLVYSGSTTSSSYNHHAISRQCWGKGDGVSTGTCGGDSPGSGGR